MLPQIIVRQLLEADGADEIDPKEYMAWPEEDRLKAEAEGKLTPEKALAANTFYSRGHYYSDNKTHVQVRRNGKTQTWKTRPGEFKIPVKYGFRDCFYITHRDADQWSVKPLPNRLKPKI